MHEIDTVQRNTTSVPKKSFWIWWNTAAEMPDAPVGFHQKQDESRGIGNSAKPLLQESCEMKPCWILRFLQNMVILQYIFNLSREKEKKKYNIIAGLIWSVGSFCSVTSFCYVTLCGFMWVEVNNNTVKPRGL